jgi:hypothetical protein
MIVKTSAQHQHLLSSTDIWMEDDTQYYDIGMYIRHITYPQRRSLTIMLLSTSVAVPFRLSTHALLDIGLPANCVLQLGSVTSSRSTRPLSDPY